jgi:hypothetical protein
VRLSPRVAIAVTAVVVVVAAAAVIAFIWAGSATSPTASPSFIGGKENGPPTATASKPTLNPEAPLLTAAPKPGSASGRLVEGFPAVLAPPDGATVTSSSVATEGSRVQAALTAGLAASPAEVQAAYAARLGALGMTSAPGSGQPGTTVTSFYRGTDSITVTTSASADGTALSVFALFTVRGR